MSAAGYQQVIAAKESDRRDLFLTTASRLGTPVGNVEKDFWVCWTLDQLYHARIADQPRMSQWEQMVPRRAFGRAT